MDINGRQRGRRSSRLSSNRDQNISSKFQRAVIFLHPIARTIAVVYLGLGVVYLVLDKILSHASSSLGEYIGPHLIKSRLSRISKLYSSFYFISFTTVNLETHHITVTSRHGVPNDR